MQGLGRKLKHALGEFVLNGTMASNIGGAWNTRLFSMINFDKLELNTHATSSQRVGEQ